tara:strand:+ start:9 stop:752 length:744 start_codon:yes stop_codon:yes gene_type:complete
MSISVCLATYNGEKFIKKQISSILSQIASNDEVIVIDDCSSDNTVKIIESLKDKRITIYLNNKNRREVYSFNRAIELAKNDFIFLSDQDDIWIDDRVKTMKKYINNFNLVSSNFFWIDKNDKKIEINYDGVKSENSKKYISNIIDIFKGKTNYYGCAMAFHSDLKKIIYPIPNYVESHDLWIAKCANIYKRNIHIDEKTLLKRNHQNNTTSTISTRPFYLKIFARIIFIISIFTILFRILKLKVNDR